MEKLIEGIINLEHEFVVGEVEKKLGDGISPIKILDACREGMSQVGDRFQSGEYYLSELMLSASIFNAAMEVLQPALLKERPAEAIGTIVLATLKGDIHDLGKNIFASLLTANGFEVHDLGVDVDPKELVAKVAEVKPDFVGLSALITTVFESMKSAVEMLEQQGLRSGFKLMVGGGVTTPMIKDHLRADFQTTNAMDGIAYCMAVAKGEQA